MTDEELIARLRHGGRIVQGNYAAFAAGRIEALVKENNDLKRRCINAEAAILPLVDEREQTEARAERLVKERNEALNQLDSARYSVEVLEKRVAHFMALNARLKAQVKAAFHEGFLVGKEDGWVNNPRIESEWKQSRARALLAEVEAQCDDIMRMSPPLIMKGDQK